MIVSTYSVLQTLDLIITDRPDNIQKYQSKNYLSEDNKEECQEEITEYKTDVIHSLIFVKSKYFKILLWFKSNLTWIIWNYLWFLQMIHL